MTTPITKEQALIASLEEDLRAVRMGLIACTTHGGTEKAEDGIPRVDRSLDALATLRSFIESHPVPQVQALEDARDVRSLQQIGWLTQAGYVVRRVDGNRDDDARQYGWEPVYAAAAIRSK